MQVTPLLWGVIPGRGTTRPFQIVGAPFLTYEFAREMRALGLCGVVFREAFFTPTFSKWAGKCCPAG